MVQEEGQGFAEGMMNIKKVYQRLVVNLLEAQVWVDIYIIHIARSTPNLTLPSNYNEGIGYIEKSQPLTVRPQLQVQHPLKGALICL